MVKRLSKGSLGKLDDCERDLALLADVTNDGATVTVTFVTKVGFPVVNAVARAWSGGYGVPAVVRARPPFTR